jgi:hypothetical protein
MCINISSLPMVAERAAGPCSPKKINRANLQTKFSPSESEPPATLSETLFIDWPLRQIEATIHHRTCRAHLLLTLFLYPVEETKADLSRPERLAVAEAEKRQIACSSI